VVQSVVRAWVPASQLTRSSLFTLAGLSVTHSCPSGPVAMLNAPLPDTRPGYSVMVPSGVMRATRSAPPSTNHMLPSGPRVIPFGPCPLGSDGSYGRAYSVTTPDMETRPMTSAPHSVNHTYPSMPAATRQVGLLVVNSVSTPLPVIRPM
jgi:hypothetical protein